ncbi:MAG: alpha-1,2-fucosyltransferase [Bacteroidales bacterium]|nr:alpha-1,2-fucosyltransferase [Bacteroidales bacterium]MCM1414563.1 alpha-1,2-fucosyltransferase [bacterium]MCM1422613.1 alpha-1,2-fucosyltransferase [bacterium]
MIIIRVMGGLGNQLQQYALYRKLQSLGIGTKLDLSWFSQKQQAGMDAPRRFELSDFTGLPFETASEEEVRALLKRTYEEKRSLTEKIRRRIAPGGLPLFEESEMFHPEIFGWQDKYLVGYWACEAYYADILGGLREEIRFPESGDPRNREIMEEMGMQRSVSIHVRRGDYLDAANTEVFGGICTEAYYDTCVRYIKKKEPEAVFYVFSDDANYVRERYQGPEYRIVDWNRGKDSFYDMQLMSCCRHNICANSTFSFWGARLNGNAAKIMIRPSIHKNTQTCAPKRMKELWSGWTLITPEGTII